MNDESPFLLGPTGLIDELWAEKNQLAPFIDDETGWTKELAPFRRGSVTDD